MKIISFDNVVKQQNLPEITNEHIFSNLKTLEYNVNGLHSPIFYPDETARRNQLAYIRTNQPFIHPLLLKVLKRSKAILYEGLLGINPVIIEKNTIKRNENGLTGLKLLEYILNNISDLSSIFSKKIFDIFLNYKSELICNSVIVIPPVFRSLTFLEDKPPIVSDIDKLYIRLLNFQKIKDLSFFNLQNLILQIEETLFSIIKGKSGVIRDFVFSRRVDFSARTVITVDPTIDIDHISIPYRVLGQIFAPEVIHYLLYPNDVIYDFLKTHNLSFPKTIDGCLYLLNQFYHSKLSSEIETILENVIEIAVKNKLVIAKRDPVLHKHSVFSFYVKGISSKVQKVYTCGISPLITTPLNADFDGDTMAIFTTHSVEGNEELKKMLPSENLFSIKNGENVFKIKNEYALAIFILTNGPEKFLKKENPPSLNLKYPDSFEDNLSLLKKYPPNTLIHVNFLDSSFFNKKAEITTLGRYLLNLTHGISNFFINETLDKNKSNELFSEVVTLLENKNLFRKFTLNITHLVDFILHLYPVSFSIKDFEIPDSIRKILFDSKNIIEFEKNLDLVVKNSLDYIKTNSPSLHIQLSSKARGGVDDIKQISIARGTTVDPYNIIDVNPIKESYFSGLSSENIYNSASGWRSSIIDSRLGISVSGFLYKKLVFLLKNLKINTYDCKTTNGLKIKVTENLIPSLKNRYLLNKVLIEKPELYLNKEIIIRSPIYCKDSLGICRICYGKLVDKFNSNFIGHFTAQSIGEVSSQSLLRSFHVSGVSSLIDSSNIINSLPTVFEYKNDLIYANNNLSFEVPSENVKIFKDKIFIYPSFISINDLDKNTSFSYDLPFVLIIKKERIEAHPHKIICNFSKHEVIGSLAFVRKGIVSAVEKMNSFLIKTENTTSYNFYNDLLSLFNSYSSFDIPLIHFEILFSELLRTDDGKLWRLNQEKTMYKFSYLNAMKLNNSLDAVVFYDPVTSIIDSLM